jgi:hypothetical protein
VVEGRRIIDRYLSQKFICLGTSQCFSDPNPVFFLLTEIAATSSHHPDLSHISACNHEAASSQSLCLGGSCIPGHIAFFSSLNYRVCTEIPPKHLSKPCTRLPLSLTANVAPASTLYTSLVDTFSSCPSTSYLLATQPGASIADYAAPGAAPHLRRAVVNGTDGLKERIIVPEVFGELDLDRILMMLLQKCGATIVHADPSSKTSPSSPSIECPIRFPSR